MADAVVQAEVDQEDEGPAGMTGLAYTSRSRGKLDLKLKSKWRSGDFDDSRDKDWLTLAVSLFHPSLSCSIDPTSINQHPAAAREEASPPQWGSSA